ncbi:hypothetical protein LWI28_014440 [Acer negundo]|uniref:Uncharacterized protein n=1 Tax=Acer negundo TaxID=4023 RepID=A0AAD5J601_ACENE|nr:hypothetical protein LWI28_014440 [Acer negundo]
MSYLVWLPTLKVIRSSRIRIEMQQGSGHANVGAGKNGTYELNKKGVESGIIPMKVTPLKKNGKSVITEVVRSRNFIAKKKLNLIANKYLIDPSAVESSPSKFFKESGKEVWIKKTGKGTKKNSLQLNSVQPISMEEDNEDSKVLQNLHKKMVEIRVAEDQLPSISDNPSPVEMINSDCGQQTVVVSDESNLKLLPPNSRRQ